MTFTEFVKKHNGGKWDFDGAFSSQCVDLMRFYIRDVLGNPQPLSITGAKDFWSNYSKDLNLKNCYQQIKNTPEAVPQEGDILIWDSWTGNPFGHVAMFIKGGLNAFESLDQNWNGKLTTSIVKHNYLNPPVLGWFKPNKNMNFIDLKKKLSDVSWSELNEFSSLEKLGLIERQDSIQTMMMKWLKSNSDMSINQAKSLELLSKRDETIVNLNKEITGLKTEIEGLKKASTDEIAVLIDRADSLQKANDTQLAIIRDFEESNNLFNLIKSWLKK